MSSRISCCPPEYVESFRALVSDQTPADKMQVAVKALQDGVPLEEIPGAEELARQLKPLFDRLVGQAHDEGRAAS